MSLEPIAMGEIEPEATLEDCEQALHQVERNAAIQQGIILRHIRDTGLYKEKDGTFEAYVEKHLGYERTWAYRRIELADAVSVLAIANTPPIENVGQARAIKPVLRDHGPEVAAEVLREAADDDGNITARSITEATSRVIEPEVITSEEWMAREGYDEPSADDLLPQRSKFERAFWQHLRQAQELAKDLDYPQHFTEPMVQMVADVVDTLTRKQTSLSARGLRVVNGGNA